MKLIALLDDRSLWVRLDAVQSLSTRRGAVVKVALRSALTDRSSTVRGAAAECLGWIGDRSDGPRLARLAVTDPDWAVRSDACDAICCMRDTRQSARLLRIAKSDIHPAVRRDAALAVARIGARVLLPDTALLATETAGFARIGILWATYFLGDRTALPHLVAAMSDPDMLVRDNAINTPNPDDIHPDDLADLISALRTVAETDPAEGARGDAKHKLSELAAPEA